MEANEFTQAEWLQLSEQGITKEQVEQQLERFQNGFPFADLVRPCVPGDGMLNLKDELDELIHFFDSAATAIRLIKFVPASGAATRMFKDLYQAVDQPESGPVHTFVNQLQDFAFFDDLKQHLIKNGHSIEGLQADGAAATLCSALLSENGLNYGQLPKGLIAFHRYPNGIRTSVEEHLVEGAQYARQNDGTVALHFTVSAEHMDRFKALLKLVIPSYEQRYKVQYKLDFSIQNPASQTLAVDLKNHPLRNSDGQLVLRPAGHGALLENLESCNADLVFIKNIDNVLPDYRKETTQRYKKALAGYLLRLQEKLFKTLIELESSPTEAVCAAACLLVVAYFGRKPDSKEPKELIRQLNRPLRVCGMVRNQGEPGGGPFWVRNNKGEVSAQIVETAQIDPNLAEQQAQLASATHFNPVDLVCGISNFKGEAFRLSDFSDPATGFIAVKSQGGKELKAQELPGLWNGAMANWNTVFVEVPLETFNPVKTVIDLLKPEHQPKETTLSNE